MSVSAKPIKCPKCGQPGGLQIGRVQVVCPKCEKAKGDDIAPLSTESPPDATSPPETIKDTGKEFKVTVAPENEPKATGPPCYAEATGLLRMVFYNPTPAMLSDLRAVAAKHRCPKMGLNLLTNI